MVRMRCSGILSSAVNVAVGGSCKFPCRPLKLLLLLVGLSALAWLPAIVLTEGQFDHPGPINLTDMINGHHPIDYNVFDQCLPRAEMRDDIQSYALEFKMPSNFLCGNEGLLICYPGQLDATNTETGMTMNIENQVNNKKGNKVAEACKEKRQKLCQKNPEDCGANGELGNVEWHGILVRTEDDGSLSLNLSIADKGHLLRQEHMIDHMQIQLSSSKRGYNTLIRFPIRKTTMMDKDERYDNFMKLAEHGCYMEELPGLWMLAMDMLPIAKQQILDLFVYRDSQCTMQAWFVRPFDQYGPPPTEISAGSSDDQHGPAATVQKHVPLGVLGAGEKLQLWLFIPFDDQSTNIRVQIKFNDQLIFIATIVRRQIIYGSNNPEDLGKGFFNFETTALNKSAQIRVGITNANTATRPIYEFSFEEGNKIHEKRRFFHKGWNANNAVGNSNSNKVMIVNGTNVVFGKVERLFVDVKIGTNVNGSGTNNVNGSENGVYREIKLTKAVGRGTKIIGKIMVLANANTFQFNLLHDAPEFHPYMGATMLRIQWFKENDTIFWGSFHHSRWKIAETFTNAGFLKPDDMLQCVLSIDYVDKTTKNATIEIKVNNWTMGTFQSDLPIWTLNWLQLSGDIAILDEPYIEYGKEHSDLVKYDLPHLFNYGNTLCFEAKMQEEFTIYLFHESSEFSEIIGDTVLQMHVDSSEEKLTLKRYLNHVNKWIEEQQGGNSVFHKRKNEDILIQIVAGVAKFEISLNGANNLVGFLDYVDTKPWLVNWITLKGLTNVRIAENSNRCMGYNTEKLAPLPSDIKQLYPDDLLTIGDEIHISGIVEETKVDINNNQADPKVLVYLFREALQFNERFGQTVLRVHFSKDEFNLNSFIPDCNPTECKNDWMRERKSLPIPTSTIEDTPLEAGQPFKLRIKAVGKTQFSVFYGKHALNWSDTDTPLWAVQYIVVNGLNTAKGIKIDKVTNQNM